MIKSIDHIGIAVKSLEQAIPRYEQALGLTCTHIETVAHQGVRTAFFAVGEGAVRIELLEATIPESPIARFIEKRGEGIHHIAFESTDVAADLEVAVGGGCVHLNQIGQTGAGGARVAFLHPKSLCGVLTELCDSHRAAASDSIQASTDSHQS